MEYYLYILQSIKFEKYYIGISQNPQKRLQYHNSFEKGFTSRYRPWKIVFIQLFNSKEVALKTEKRLKNWKSKLMIERVIKGEISI
jgi:putative endonuclease